MAKPVAKAGGLDPKKVTGELFTLTYGALVTQLIADYEDDDVVNSMLDKIGYNIGVRMIDDFFAKNANVGKCGDLRAVADVLARQGFKSYLGIIPTVSGWSASGDEFSLVFDANPLAEFVELPPDRCMRAASYAHCALGMCRHSRLRYSQILCGAIRGAMEATHIEVQAWFIQDQLSGAATNEIRVKFVRRIVESVPTGDD